ncbi:carbohydrate esterase family 8 protein [Mycena vulgaris]|nr:carbohydrate esterase family 8 protein [Mycena vulgaris]
MRVLSVMAAELIGFLAFCAGAFAASRTTPPTSAVIVRGSGTLAGELKTIEAAVTSPADTSAQVIFIFPGTYTEQVHITRTGTVTLLGSTNNTASYTSNVVRISFGLSQATAGGGDLSATLRINKDNFAMYNIDVVNTFGTGSQALAVAAYGTNAGFYGVGFYGFQDTLRAEKGVQFYGSCYVEGAVDFIFGQHGHAFFHRNTIASIAPGAITADGPDTSDESLFVINESNITTGATATQSLIGTVFLGRPWTAAARVAYISSTLGPQINAAGWEPWSAAMPQTDGVLFAEFGSTGPGAAGARAPFATKLSSPTGFGIADVLGASWTTWVDATYFT